MTDQEIREAAANFAETILGIPAKQISPDDTIIAGFTAGAQWAEKEAYNAGLNDAIKTLNRLAIKDGIIKFLIEELKKLSK